MSALDQRAQSRFLLLLGTVTLTLNCVQAVVTEQFCAPVMIARLLPTVGSVPVQPVKSEMRDAGSASSVPAFCSSMTAIRQVTDAEVLSLAGKTTVRPRSGQVS